MRGCRGCVSCLLIRIRWKASQTGESGGWVSLGMAGSSAQGRLDEIRDGWIFREAKRCRQSNLLNLSLKVGSEKYTID